MQLVLRLGLNIWMIVTARDCTAVAGKQVFNFALSGWFNESEFGLCWQTIKHQSML